MSAAQMCRSALTVSMLLLAVWLVSRGFLGWLHGLQAQVQP